MPKPRTSEKMTPTIRKAVVDAFLLVEDFRGQPLSAQPTELILFGARKNVTDDEIAVMALRDTAVAMIILRDASPARELVRRVSPDVLSRGGALHLEPLIDDVGLDPTNPIVTGVQMLRRAATEWEALGDKADKQLPHLVHCLLRSYG